MIITVYRAEVYFRFFHIYVDLMAHYSFMCLLVRLPSSAFFRWGNWLVLLDLLLISRLLVNHHLP